MIDTVVHDVKICVHIFSFTLTLYFCYTGSFQHYIIQLHGRKKIWGGGVGTGTWLADISCLETFQFQFSISTPGTCLAESVWNLTGSQSISMQIICLEPDWQNLTGGYFLSGNVPIPVNFHAWNLPGRICLEPDWQPVNFHADYLSGTWLAESDWRIFLVWKRSNSSQFPRLELAWQNLTGSQSISMCLEYAWRILTWIYLECAWQNVWKLTGISLVKRILMSGNVPIPVNFHASGQEYLTGISVRVLRPKWWLTRNEVLLTHATATIKCKASLRVDSNQPNFMKNYTI